MSTINPPLKWHGGKHYLASKLVAMMPPHIHYVEPFFGGGSVLLAKDPEGVSEVVNDLNTELACFWRVLQHSISFDKFKKLIDDIPFSEHEFESAKDRIESLASCFAPARIPDGVETVKRATWFFIRCRQSLAGRMKDFASISRNRTRRGMNEQASAWLTAVEGLPAVHARLKRVVILNRDALDVIKQQDGPNTLFYCDPPYLHETRATTGEYKHEMTEEQHQALLAVLHDIDGKFMLSGYRSDLYDRWADEFGWRRVDFDLPNNSAGGATKRRMIESVWMNFEPESMR